MGSDYEIRLLLPSPILRRRLTRPLAHRSLALTSSRHGLSLFEPLFESLLIACVIGARVPILVGLADLPR
jgi:hypothetical protein